LTNGFAGSGDPEWRAKGREVVGMRNDAAVDAPVAQEGKKEGELLGKGLI
jgi:hypothetical protein